MSPVQILDTAQFAEAIVGQTVTPEIGGEGLGHNHPASGVDGGPVAMKRHFNPAVRAEHRGGLPGDVGEQAGGRAGRVVGRRPARGRRRVARRPSRRTRIEPAER